MADTTEAEKIAHYWAKQTTAAISWTGGLTFLVALCTLIFNIWARYVEHGDEEKRRKRADALDRARRRKNDTEDEARRRRHDEEDNERRRKKEEEEAEREEEGREAERRRVEAALKLEKMIEEFRGDHLRILRSLSAVRPDAAKVAKLHKAQLELKNSEIDDLKRKNAMLRRQIESSPGWAPGGSGQNPTATGG